MANILLIEPNYKCKQPPLGLMKISYFHKNILNDYVRFTKGKLPEALATTKWDHIYITTLFTFEWKTTIAAIEYAKTLVDSPDKITIGGIAATILPDEIHKATGIQPVCGLLNKPGKLGLPGDECIDQMTPDYSILEDVDYVYPIHDAYFLSATKGCGNNCGFCAVQTLEPEFNPYIDIKEKIAKIDKEYGPKKDLILMDNNVLRSPKFNEIIDDIKAAGFEKGASYSNPRTGKTVQRHIDFNQGLDALFLTENKAKRLGEIALSPARIAFDHIEDKDIYERAIRLCAKYEITELSNYILYNSEEFGGKGKLYQADTPEDLYERMHFTLCLTDELNKDRPSDVPRFAAFSFPMRYIPLTAHERGYVGSMWNAKFLRAVQRMLVPTQGKGVCNRSFFEADFGKNPEEFVRFLCMPEKLIANRGNISRTSRGKTKETDEEFSIRKAEWIRCQEKIKIWNRLYDELDGERGDFIKFIGDNVYLPENFFGTQSLLQRKLYLLYLTTPRLFALLKMVDSSSPSYKLVYDFITEECPYLYQDMLELLCDSEIQQNYIFSNFLSFFGRKGVKDLLEKLSVRDFNADKLLAKWDKICKKTGIEYIDFELIRIYRRYIDMKILPEEVHQKAIKFITSMNMVELAALLLSFKTEFEDELLSYVSKENGAKILNSISKTISENIQIKLFSLIEDANDHIGAPEN